MTNIDPPAAPLEAHLGFWLRFVSNHVSARFRQRVEEEGTTVTEWVALRALYDRPLTTHSALIQALGMTKGAVSKVASRLENKGLVRRQPVPDRPREQALSLTRKGRALVPKLATLADENEAHFFGHLPVSERQQLAKTLQELVARHGFKEVPTA
ncbi:MAG TPA: MarR family winged helix-turn-helix transcriptional regulator [Steroidobacteraceae bacterium]|nr:MarR family winged helix-turn-helix transcriptional regulator [Steroidobacteraceae bacterium]